MDKLDRQLLAILTEDSSCTATDISSKINLSIPAVNKRIAKLKSTGVIEKFTIQVNPKKIEKNVQAFIMLVVNQYVGANELETYIKAKKDIIDCYAITGEYDYLLRVYSKDIEELEDVLLELKNKKCVSKSQTLFVLKEHKHLSGPLPD